MANEQTLSQADLHELTQIHEQMKANGDPRADRIGNFLQTYPIPDTTAQAGDALKSLVKPENHAMVPQAGRHRTSLYQPDTRTPDQQAYDRSTADTTLNVMGVAIPPLVSMGMIPPAQIPLALIGGGGGGYIGARAGGGAGEYFGGLVGEPDLGRSVGTLIGSLGGAYMGGSFAKSAVPQMLQKFGVTTGPSWLGLKPAAQQAEEQIGAFMNRGYKNTADIAPKPQYPEPIGPSAVPTPEIDYAANQKLNNRTLLRSSPGIDTRNPASGAGTTVRVRTLTRPGVYEGAPSEATHISQPGQDLITRTQKISIAGEPPSPEDLKRAGDLTQAPLSRLRTLAKFNDRLAQNELNRRLKQ